MNSTNEIIETSVTEGARRATGVTDVSTQKTYVPDSEVRVPIKRPRHTDNYKQEVVAHVAELRETGGETGSYLRTKGLYFSTVKKWENKLNNGHKKIVVTLQTAFYNTLPSLPECDKSKADFAFFLYDLVPDKKTKTLSLKLQRIVYTRFADALEQIAKFEAGSITEFTDLLQKKLDTKLSGNSDATNLENIVVE